MVVAFLVAGLAVLPLGHSIEVKVVEGTLQKVTKATEGAREAALRLRAISQPGEPLAVVDVGALGYYSGLPIIDMVGLLDPYVAQPATQIPQGVCSRKRFREMGRRLHPGARAYLHTDAPG
jgi:hypothetical protein